jgi:hypothetical protein
MDHVFDRSFLEGLRPRKS